MKAKGELDAASPYLAENAHGYFVTAIVKNASAAANLTGR